MSKEKQIEEDELQELVITLSDCQHRYDKECIKAIVTKSPLPKENKFYAKYLMEQGYHKQSEPFSCGHEKGSEWISVEERLPEKEDDYLVYTTAGFIETDRFSVPEDKDVDGHWFELDDYVTHWTPLPEAPKMKGGEADA
jgi:hypothetical protein